MMTAIATQRSVAAGSISISTPPAGHNAVFQRLRQFTTL